MFTTKNLFKIFGKHFLIAIGAILIAVVSISILSGKIVQISASAAKNRQQASMLSQQTAMLANLKHEVEIIGSNETVFNNAFIPSNNILAFVSVLESLALRNGLTESFHFSSPIPLDLGTSLLLNTIGYQNTISTNVPAFINYLKDYESLPYFTKIDSINITSSNGNWLESSNVTFGASVTTRAEQ
ncbi:MAG: hypothetical protein WC791_02850 [Candidatus Paceibacterota bacterium]|jgi:hypothetical protein